ncbi:response regulator transcription factor [Patescibacteria group bacterium]|nr:response regulator transcription factor [Patescibacteria group bacterium]
MKHLVLLVEDDPLVARSIAQVLPKQYTMTTTSNLESSYRYLAEERPALIVLDRALPDGDGLELVEYMTQLDHTAPLLVLSRKSTVQDRINGLRKGADDYLIKPFSTTELLLRIERLLYSTKHRKEEAIRFGELELLLDKGQVILGKHILRLRRREFQVLSYLVRQNGRVVTRDQLINHIWPDGKIPSYATIDVYIRRLRMMLGPYGSIVRTIKGYGYLAEPLPIK